MILRFNIFFQDSTLELPILEHERPWDEPWDAFLIMLVTISCSAAR